MKNPNIGGFQVTVYHGKEISDKQYQALSEEERQKCRRQVNGPHNSSKWAQRQLWGLAHKLRFSRPFGNHTSLAQTYGLEVSK
jgi:hypothetical protein